MSSTEQHGAIGVVADVLSHHRVRDLVVLSLGGGRSLVIACDSSGGIGPKEADTVVASASEVAHFAARVALIEVIAAGATPEVVVNNLCVERTPTGQMMIDAIQQLVAGLGGRDILVTGSTEDNVPTRATGVGVTVIGTADDSELRPGTSKAGDAVVCVGVPLSAPVDEVRSSDPRLVSLAEVRQLFTVPGVHEVLPVGSRGIGYEATELAHVAGLAYRPVDDPGVDVTTSGGPSTCVLVSCDASRTHELRATRADLPVNLVGHLVATRSP